jgi:hypothetical protein
MYYRTVVAKKVFASCDYRLFSTLLHWAGRRHPKKRRVGVREVLATTRPRLAVHADIPIKRHVQVPGYASPL